MIKLNGYNLEAFIQSPNPEFGYVDEYVEKKMISGKIRRIYKGKRLNVNISFPYLTSDQIQLLYGFKKCTAIIDTPYGQYNGDVFCEINSLQKRYAYINNAWVWIGYSINLIGVDLIDKDNVRSY